LLVSLSSSFSPLPEPNHVRRHDRLLRKIWEPHGVIQFRDLIHFHSLGSPPPLPALCRFIYIPPVCSLKRLESFGTHVMEGKGAFRSFLESLPPPPPPPPPFCQSFPRTSPVCGLFGIIDGKTNRSKVAESVTFLRISFPPPSDLFPPSESLRLRRRLAERVVFHFYFASFRFLSTFSM